MTAAAYLVGLIAALAFGVSIGSFLNVVIWRVPRGESVASPTWSYCPNCHTRLGGWDLVPIFSFLLLGRKCRYCKKPISWRYITVETITGALFAGLFLTYGFSLDTVFYCLFASVLVAAFFIDLDYFMIPDELNVIGVVLGLALNASHIWIDPPAVGATRLPDSLVAAVVCALIFHLISLGGYLYYTREAVAAESSPSVAKKIGWFVAGTLDDYAYLLAKFTGMGLLFPRVRSWIEAHEVLDDSDEGASLEPNSGGVGLKTRDEIAMEIEADEEQTGMGQGDAKLAAAIGAVLLLRPALLSIFIAIVLGGLFSIGLLIAKRGRGRTAIPFGPYLVVGAIVVLFTGTTLLDLYQHYAFPNP